MINIIFVTAAIGYGIGGSEKALIEMLKCMDKTKYKITVLSLNKQPEKPFIHKDIKIIYGYKDFERINTPLRSIITRPWKYSLKEITGKFKIAVFSRFSKKNFSHKIWEIYKGFINNYPENYDIAVGYGLGLATFFAIDKVNANRKILWMDNDMAISGLNLDYCQKYYEASDQVAVVDKSQVERLCNVYPNLTGKVTPIRNIIPFDEIKEKAVANAGFDDGYDGVRILSVGRLSPEKNFMFAVEAAGILRRKGFNFRWYIIGFGPEEEMLREKIKQLKLEETVVLLGQKLNPYPFFAQTDIYVQTSIFEGSCITVEEAMVFYKPVVTTNFPPAYNKIIHGKNGFIVEMNSKAVAEGVEKLLSDNQLMKKMSEHQKQHPLTYDEIMQEFDSMIERTVTNEKFF